MQDVIVVGAGPAGSMAALELARRNYDVKVFESRAAPGVPQHCTGLVSEKTFGMLGVEPETINVLHNAEAVFPNGETLSLHSKAPFGVMIDRTDLDRKLAEAAQDAGALYSFNDRYITHTVGLQVGVDCKSGTHRAKMVVGADGPRSAVAMSLGENSPKEYLRGFQADLDYQMEDQDTLRIFMGNNVAPGFFAWEIPCGEFTRIGLCTSMTSAPPSEYLSDFLINRGLKDKVIKVYSGLIPVGGRQYICGDRCALIGDAACQVKPLSGGGLYPMCKARGHLVETVSKCLDADTLSQRDLSEYDRACKKDFGGDLAKAYSMRKKYVKLSDEDFNRFYEYLRKNDVEEQLSNADIDNPADVVKEVLSKPKAFISGIPLLLRFLI